MDEKEVLTIINPISGTRSKKGLEELVERTLGSAGMRVHFKYTRGPEDARRFASQAADSGFFAVVTAGGDGTVNEAARALVGRETALGIIPCGSGNGLARSIGVPSDFPEALRIIAAGNTITADCGTVNGLPFFCTFGVGFDAAVSEKFASMKKRGKVNYIRSALLEFLNYRPQPYSISIDGAVITEEAFLIAVCNASQYGNNAYIAPKASLTDGLLDLTVIHSGSPFSTALVGVDLLTGYIDRNTLIDTFRISSATLTRLRKGPAHFDGEPVELGRVLEVECSPAALRLLTPSEMPEFKPVISPIRAFFSDLHYDLLNLLRRH